MFIIIRFTNFDYSSDCSQLLLYNLSDVTRQLETLGLLLLSLSLEITYTSAFFPCHERQASSDNSDPKPRSEARPSRQHARCLDSRMQGSAAGEVQRAEFAVPCDLQKSHVALAGLNH